MTEIHKMKTLSYSSMTKLAKCEQKYWHHKVAKTKIDWDTDASTTNLDVGKAFHKILEDTDHAMPPMEILKKHIRASCNEYNCIEHTTMIFAMCLKYYEIHSKSRLKLVHQEFSLKDKEFEGYIDAIVADKHGNWWFMDMKTAKRFDENKVRQLHRDPQISLYASYYKKTGEYFNLDPKKFRGCIYRVITKPSLKQSKKESNQEYLARMTGNCKVIDIHIPLGAMALTEMKDLFIEYYNRAKCLHEGEAPKKNYANCFDYFRPCEWFSRCHGTSITQNSPSTVEDPEFFVEFNKKAKAKNRL